MKIHEGLKGVDSLEVQELRAKHAASATGAQSQSVLRKSVLMCDEAFGLYINGVISHDFTYVCIRSRTAGATLRLAARLFSWTRRLQTFC